VLVEDRLSIHGTSPGAFVSRWDNGLIALNAGGYIELDGGTFDYKGGEIDYTDNGANDLGYFYLLNGGTLNVRADTPKIGAFIYVGRHSSGTVSAGTLKLSQGTIAVAHNAGIEVTQMGVLRALGGNIEANPGTGQIANWGRVDVTASNLSTGMVIRNQAGTVEVGQGKTLTIPNTFQYEPYVNASITQAGGQTILNDGAQLVINGGYVQSGGSFLCKDAAFGAAGSWDVHNWMDIRAGGLILGDQARTFGTLTVHGALTLGVGSTLSIDVDSGHNNVCDKAVAFGAVTIANGAALSITTSTPQRPSSENRWTFLTGSSISGPFTTITQGGLFTHWIAFIDGNSYKLRAPPITGLFNNIFGAIEATPWSGTVAGFTDPLVDNPTPDMYRATIDWGDGNTTSNATITADGEGGFIVTGSHTWAKWGFYPMTVTVQLVAEPFDTFHWDGTAEVGDVLPIVYDGGPGATITVGSTFTSWCVFRDPGADTWTVIVDYGDGSDLQSLTVSPDNPFTVSHTYTTVGEFYVRAMIYDTGGAGEGATWIVTVYDPSEGGSAPGGAGGGGAAASTAQSSPSAGTSVLAPVTSTARRTLHQSQGERPLAGSPRQRLRRLKTPQAKRIVVDHGSEPPVPSWRLALRRRARPSSPPAAK
jgi:hypothetical protein